jgi:hypothetical protein
MPYIGTCFRFYTQMRVQTKAFAYRIYSHFTQQCILSFRVINCTEKKIDIQLIILQQPNKMLKTPYAFEFYFTLFLKIISNLFQFFIIKILALLFQRNINSFVGR